MRQQLCLSRLARHCAAISFFQICFVELTVVESDMKKIFFLLFYFCLATRAEIKKPAMNGYRLNDYIGFEKKWALVTVRFRKDTGELRFTYANDLAYKTLKKGMTDFPDGSVFAKIGFKTEEDPGFPSSAVPSGARRYQYMVKNKKLHATTDGWGYALFDKDGNVFPEPLDIQTAACAACHHIMPERGFVFSQLLELSPGKNNFSKKNELVFQDKLKFTLKNKNQFSIEIQKLVPASVSELSFLDNKISMYLFQGSLDEIKPALSREAVRTKKPAVIASPDEKSFALVQLEEPEVTCEAQGKKGFYVKAVSLSPLQNGKLNENRYCWAD